MALRFSQQPTSEPVSIADIRAFCRQDLTVDDGQLADLVATFREKFEANQNLQLMQATLVLTLAAFPDADIELPRPPLISVTSVAYYDSSNVLQAMNAADYQVAVSGQLSVSVGVLKPVTSWPATYDRPDAVEITYVAGFASSSQVPASLKTAIKMMVREVYEGCPNRPEHVAARIHSLVAPFRRRGF